MTICYMKQMFFPSFTLCLKKDALATSTAFSGPDSPRTLKTDFFVCICFLSSHFRPPEYISLITAASLSPSSLGMAILFEFFGWFHFLY